MNPSAIPTAPAQEEVRYHLLRPHQAVSRREQCPIAYLPLGTIEWHGPHNPLGADALQAEYLAVRCAQMGGGVAFPALYYGENRLEALMEANPGSREAIAGQMRLDPENFTPAHFLYDETEQTRAYHQLLLHLLNQAESLGFQVAVFVCGHYPLVDHAAMAVLEYNKKRRKVGKLLAWATTDYQHLKGKYAFAGDHGGGWETSHLLCSQPELVDLSLLPPKGEPLVGCGGRLAPQDAQAALGAAIYDEAAQIIVREARHRLENPRLYRAHGMSMATGLWQSAPQDLPNGKQV